MASLKDLRDKIKGVGTTRQITSAMKLMATARVGGAIRAVKETQGYIERLIGIISQVAYKARQSEIRSGLYVEGEIKKVCNIVVGGERGLCGSFNYDLHDLAYKEIKKTHISEQTVIVIGKRPVQYLKVRGIPVHQHFDDLPMYDVDRLSVKLLALSREIFKDYKKHKYDMVNIIYTSFNSAASMKPVAKQIFPIVPHHALEPTLRGKSTLDYLYDFEPEPLAMLHHLQPRYIYFSLLTSALESYAAEQVSRMNAMTSANDRAEEMMEELNTTLNRIRQSAITQEIIEVISGSVC